MAQKPNDFGGYITLNSFVTTPEYEHIPLAEVIDRISTGEEIEIMCSDLKPAKITAVKQHEPQLVSHVELQGASGVVATDNHCILTVTQQENQYHFTHVPLADLEEGDTVMVEPKIEGSQFTFKMSSFNGLRPLGLEDVYELVVENNEKGRKFDGVLINGLVNLQPEPSDKGKVVTSHGETEEDTPDYASEFNLEQFSDSEDNLE